MRFLAILLAAGILLPFFAQDAEAGRRHRAIVYRSCPSPVYYSRHYYPSYYPSYYSHRPVLSTAAAIALHAAHGHHRYHRYSYLGRPYVRIVRRY